MFEELLFLQSSAHSHLHFNQTHETYQYTRVNVDVDIEHSHLHHNHTHHNLHQHVNTPSVYSNAKSFFNNNNSAPCTPCVYSNELHVTTNPFGEYDGKERISADKSDQVSMTPKIYTSQFSNELDYIHPIIQKLKSEFLIASMIDRSFVPSFQQSNQLVGWSYLAIASIILQMV